MKGTPQTKQNKVAQKSTYSSCCHSIDDIRNLQRIQISEHSHKNEYNAMMDYLLGE